jgi:hypothetical protein
MALILTASAQATPCPPFPVGVVNVGGVFHATAEAHALRSSQDSVELAVAEASIASRVALHVRDDVPKAPSGELHGVTQSICVVGKKAYVTSSVSPASAAQAESLGAILRRSLQTAPTRMPMNSMEQ